MRALSIRQPWAHLIACGIKQVENRSRRTTHRGPLLIHASLREDPGGDQLAQKLGIELPDELPRGGIVGSVDVVDVVNDAPGPWAIEGQWHWCLARARELPFTPVRGKLGVFEVAVPGGDA